MIPKKDLTAINLALKDMYCAFEAINATLYGPCDDMAEAVVKASVRRIHAYHDAVRDIGKILQKHNRTFDLDRFIQTSMPKQGEY